MEPPANQDSFRGLPLFDIDCSSIIDGQIRVVGDNGTSNSHSMEGWLRKRGRHYHTSMHWNRRYFVLRGTKLSYFVERGSIDPKGEFQLIPGCKVSDISIVQGDGSSKKESSSSNSDFVSSSSITNRTEGGPISEGGGGGGGKETTTSNKSSKKSKTQYYVFKVSWPGSSKTNSHDQDSNSEQQQQQQAGVTSAAPPLPPPPLPPSSGTTSGFQSPTNHNNTNVITTTTSDVESLPVVPMNISDMQQQSSKKGGSERNLDTSKVQILSPNSATSSLRNVYLGQAFSEEQGETNSSITQQPPASLKQRTTSGASLKHYKSANPMKDTSTTASKSTSALIQRRQTAGAGIGGGSGTNAYNNNTSRNYNPIQNTTTTGNNKNDTSNLQVSTTTYYNQVDLATLTQNAIDYHKKQHRKHVKKRIVQGSGLVAAAGAAAAATVLTAGVGLAAGLTFVGITAAAGGSGAVASRTYMKTKKTLATTLVLAASTRKEAQQWKDALLCAIESYYLVYGGTGGQIDELSSDEDSIEPNDDAIVQPSTWANLFAMDGHNPASALIPSRSCSFDANYGGSGGNIDDNNSISSFVVDAGGGGTTTSRGGGVVSATNSTISVSEQRTTWRPVEGGWASYLGIGYSGMRIFEEDTLHSNNLHHGSSSNHKKFSNILSVQGRSCSLLKAEAILDASPIDAFMCMMSHNRIGRTSGGGSSANHEYTPLSTQRSSFRVIEKIDDHTDVIHIMFRPMYLFPSYTKPRDYVVMRYWRLDDDGCYVLCYDSVKHRECPPMTPYYIRGDLHEVCTIAPMKKRYYRNSSGDRRLGSRGGLVVEETTTTKQQCMLTQMVQTDPKGWIPTWKMPMIANQGYADAFAVDILLQVLDVQDSLNSDKFVPATAAGDDSSRPFRSKQDKALFRTVSENVSKLVQLSNHKNNNNNNHSGTSVADDETTMLYTSPSEGSPEDDTGEGVNYDYTMCTREILSSPMSKDDDEEEEARDAPDNEDGDDDEVPQISSRNSNSRTSPSRSSSKLNGNGNGKNKLRDLPMTFPQSMWAEPDANSFMVRGPTYLLNKKKVHAGTSIFRLMAIDFIETPPSGIKGICAHPKERLQLMFRRERMGGPKAPPFVFAMNILLPGSPNHQLMIYFATDDIANVNGTSGTPSSILANKFFFGNSDEFRDNTFKLIPAVVEGNFMVRKAVGTTPAIMGTKLKQYYTTGERFFEIYLDVASSSVAAGVVRVVKGYARNLIIDIGFLLEGTEEETLPEKLIGCCRMKYVDLISTKLRFVEPIEDISSSMMDV